MDRLNIGSNLSVLQSEPYCPKPSMLSKFEGRNDEIRAIFAAWISTNSHPPLSPLMIGLPGVGKNRIVYELAKITGLKLYILQGHEDITAEDLACSVRFADGATNGMEYVLSPLVTAMINGGICFIDEIGKLRPRALSLLVSVLDERRYIDSSLLGERIVASDSFRFVAATNTGEQHDLPEFIRSRMRPVIHVGLPDKKDINEIILAQQGVHKNREFLINQFWELCAEQSLNPSARDAIQLFGLAASLGSFRKAGADSLFELPGTTKINETLAGSATPDIDSEDMEQAFNLFYGAVS